MNERISKIVAWSVSVIGGLFVVFVFAVQLLPPPDPEIVEGLARLTQSDQGAFWRSPLAPNPSSAGAI